MPLVSSYSPWKHQEASGFHGVGKKSTVIEWVNPLVHGHMDTLDINDVNTIHSLRVTKYSELRNLEDL